MRAKTGFWLLVPAGLLFAAILAGAVPSTTSQTLSAAPTTSELTLTVVTDRENYEKGETIQISGTVKDSENNPGASGTATIMFSSGGWCQKSTAQITNGNYSYNRYISFGDAPYPATTGTWTIKVTAVDDLGNTGENTKNIGVTIPASHVYFVDISPLGLSKSRGENVSISVKVTRGEVNVENAVVTSNTPTGENITLNRVGPGTYSATYLLKWGDPAGDWSISVEAKTADNKAGGKWDTVKVVPATLGVSLLSPTRTRFEVDETVYVRLRVTYPFNGGSVENENVWINTPAGENLVLAYEDNGIYGATYALGSQDIGAWSMKVTASDINGNSGYKTSVIDITPVAVPGFLAQYWWAVLSGIFAIGIASAYGARRSVRAGRLKDIQREMKEIPRLKRDAAIKYFKNGTISRGAYDKMIRKYDARMDELKKREATLKVKMKKKVKRKK